MDMYLNTMQSYGNPTICASTIRQTKCWKLELTTEILENSLQDLTVCAVIVVVVSTKVCAKGNEADTT